MHHLASFSTLSHSTSSWLGSRGKLTALSVLKFVISCKPGMFQASGDLFVFRLEKDNAA